MAESAKIYQLPAGRAARNAKPQAGELVAPAPLSAPAPAPAAPRPAPAEPLWREVLGRRLRVLRTEQGETLADTAGRAGISPQYLSEIERGRKEPSSEMIAALAGALRLTLIELTELVTDDLRRQQLVTAPRRHASFPVAPRRPASFPAAPQASASATLTLALAAL